MKLRNEGPIRPAPELTGDVATLAATVEGWAGVRSFTHWRLGAPGIVDGAEYHVGDGELGHVHLNSTAHILLGKKIVALLAERQLGRSPAWSDAWITQPVRSSADVQHAAWLFQLGYDRLAGASEDRIIDRIENASRSTSRNATTVI